MEHGAAAAQSSARVHLPSRYTLDVFFAQLGPRRQRPLRRARDELPWACCASGYGGGPRELAEVLFVGSFTFSWPQAEQKEDKPEVSPRPTQRASPPGGLIHGVARALGGGPSSA